MGWYSVLPNGRGSVDARRWVSEQRHHSASLRHDVPVQEV